MKTAPGLLHKGKRWLYLVHRWIGIATCLLLAMWFVSGAVMMYVPFPSLTEEERLAGLRPVDWANVHGPASPDTWLQQGPDGPLWLGEQTRSATQGLPLPTTDAAAARREAAAFGHANVRSASLIERDQWTVAGSYDRYRPLWKVTLDRPDGLVLYVSGKTGSVVLDTHRTERFWNWLGAVPHWIYLTVLRQDQPLWRQVILWTSGAGIVGVVSGMWIGVLRVRLRRRRYKGGRVSPYRGWQWWHHVFGLLGGTAMTLWIVSGWLSVDPNRWFADKGPGDAALARYTAQGSAPPIDWRAIGQRPEADTVKRARLIWTDGMPLLVLARTSGTASVLNARTLETIALDPAHLVQAARRILPHAGVIRTEWLTQPDTYWYKAKGTVELPVLRIRFDDPAQTWITISPRTGEILETQSARRRLYRWLFDGIHRWDFNGLITRRPLWDAWMALWLAMGTIGAISGIVIGVRRLRK